MRYPDTQLVLGVNDVGEPVVWDLKTTAHLVVMGKSGTGKSSVAQIAVANALLHGYQLVIVDPSKGAVDFTQWAKPRALAFAGEGDFDATEAAIGWVFEEMNRRSALNGKYGVGNMTDLPEDVRPRRLLVLFDEFNSYINGEEKTFANPTNDVTIANVNAEAKNRNRSIQVTGSRLAKIALQGRSLGINLLFGAQRLSIDDMSHVSGGNQFFRTLGRMMLGSDSLQGVVSQSKLREANRMQRDLQGEGGKIPVGRGLYESADSELTSIQSWWSGGQSALTGVVEGVPAVEPVDITPYLPQTAEKYGEIDVKEILPDITTEAQEQVEEATEAPLDGWDFSFDDPML